MMYLQDNEKKKPRAEGGKVEKNLRTGRLDMRATPGFLAALSAAANDLNLGKTELIERAVVAFCPSYFGQEGAGVSPATEYPKYAPQTFERPEGEKKPRRGGGQPSTKAKRSGKAVAKNSTKPSGG